MPNARLCRAAAALLVAAPLALLPLASCDRTVRPTEALPPLAPASADAGAGGWRMFVLNAPDQIAVAPPAAVGSDAYTAELAALKAAQAAMTDAQRRNVAHWAGGGVLRWNQTMRELVARYNLPPAPRAACARWARTAQWSRSASRVRRSMLRAANSCCTHRAWRRRTASGAATRRWPGWLPGCGAGGLRHASLRSQWPPGRPTLCTARDNAAPRRLPDYWIK